MRPQLGLAHQHRSFTCSFTYVGLDRSLGNHYFILTVSQLYKPNNEANIVLTSKFPKQTIQHKHSYSLTSFYFRLRIGHRVPVRLDLFYIARSCRHSLGSILSTGRPYICFDIKDKWLALGLPRNPMTLTARI